MQLWLLKVQRKEGLWCSLVCLSKCTFCIFNCNPINPLLKPENGWFNKFKGNSRREENRSWTEVLWVLYACWKWKCLYVLIPLCDQEKEIVIPVSSTSTKYLLKAAHIPNISECKNPWHLFSGPYLSALQISDWTLTAYAYRNGGHV